MFHLEQGWWLGVKSCSARTIYTNAEGRKGEVDISVSLAGAQTNPWCVCFYLCADWWNELWVWEIDSGWGWSSSFPFLACLLAGRLSVFTHLSSPLPFLLPVGSPQLFSQMGGSTNKVGYLVLSVLFYLTTCLLAQVKLLHHCCLSFTVSFYLRAKSSVFFENLCNLLV